MNLDQRYYNLHQTGPCHTCHTCHKNLRLGALPRGSLRSLMVPVPRRLRSSDSIRASGGEEHAHQAPGGAWDARVTSTKAKNEINESARRFFYMIYYNLVSLHEMIINIRSWDKFQHVPTSSATLFLIPLLCWPWKMKHGWPKSRAVLCDCAIRSCPQIFVKFHSLGESSGGSAFSSSF